MNKLMRTNEALDEGVNEALDKLTDLVQNPLDSEFTWNTPAWIHGCMDA